jgi:hypothetical protein
MIEKPRGGLKEKGDSIVTNFGRLRGRGQGRKQVTVP